MLLLFTYLVIIQIAELFLTDLFQAIVKQLTTDPSCSSLTFDQYYQPQMPVFLTDSTRLICFAYPGIILRHFS